MSTDDTRDGLRPMTEQALALEAIGRCAMAVRSMAEATLAALTMMEMMLHTAEPDPAPAPAPDVEPSPAGDDPPVAFTMGSRRPKAHPAPDPHSDG